MTRSGGLDQLAGEVDRAPLGTPIDGCLRLHHQSEEHRPLQDDAALARDFLTIWFA